MPEFTRFYMENSFANKIKRQIDVKMMALVYPFLPDTTEINLARKLKIEQNKLRYLLKKNLLNIINDITQHWTYTDFKTINGTLKSLFKRLKPN